MEIIRCKNGHSYAPSITPECPECAKLKGETVALEETTDDIGKTVPVTERKYPQWPEAEKYNEVKDEAEDYGHTMPIRRLHTQEEPLGEGHLLAEEILPVAGWLVCIDGPSKGKDYRIHEENNYIGRMKEMDICIEGDPTVSRENHAIIAYDTEEKIFYFAPVRGASIVRVNGKAVLNNVELKAYDRLTIGKSQFLFIPFCGDMFSWDNQ